MIQMEMISDRVCCLPHSNPKLGWVEAFFKRKFYTEHLFFAVGGGGKGRTGSWVALQSVFDFDHVYPNRVVLCEDSWHTRFHFISSLIDFKRSCHDRFNC